MLSETWRLLQALERSGIMCSRKHKRIQVPGRTPPCVRVCLNDDGKVKAIQDISEDDWPTWTVMEGNKNSFPVVRIQEPLYSLSPEHEAWTKLGYGTNGRRRRPNDQERIDVFANILKSASPQPLSSRTQSLWRRLRDQKAKELADCAETDPKLEPVKRLASCFILAANSPEELIKNVAAEAVARLSQDRLHAIDFVEQLLVGKGPPKENGKLPTMTIQIAFDVEGVEGQCCSLYDHTTRDRLIEVLPQDLSCESDTKNRAKTAFDDLDAFTGNPEDIEKKTFPKVDLPVPSARRTSDRVRRKRFPLASMFSEAHCNTRYGMTDARVFPLAKDRATKLKEALEEITSDSRREKTWQHVASGRFETQGGRKIERPDLLIAYVEDKPDLNVKTAGYFGQGSAVIETQFEVDSSAVCNAFRGIVNEKPYSRLNLFLIRDVSKGQTQIVLAESPPVKEVLEAAERWQRVARENIPPVRIYLPEDRKRKIPVKENAEPSAPYPDQVIRLLSHQWIRDGSVQQAIVGPGLGEVLNLMLRTEGKWKPAAQRLLSLLIQRVSPLLIGLFAAKHAFSHGAREPLDNYPRESRETALRAVAVLGILLDSLDSRKENYMRDAPYQVGQMLALADTLHKDYCMVVRGGQLPNSLIGTSLMRRALDNPVGALADLGERILEYVRWAKVAQISDNWDGNDQRRIAVNEARKKLRQYQDLAEALGQCELPNECNDLMKAQLLLGFLATPPEEN